MGSSEDQDPRPLRDFSCLLCRQRKVKCDRHDPCANCLKAQTQCDFVAPVRGRRGRKPKAVHEGLHAKLRRYELILEKHGERLDEAPEEDMDCSDNDAASEPAFQRPTTESSMSIDSTPQDHTTRYNVNSSSRYFDSTLWSSIGSDLKQPSNDRPHEQMEPMDSADENDAPLLSWLEGRPSRTEPSLDLREFYPDAATFYQLQHIFTDKIDNMLKMLHLPSLFNTLNAALTRPDGMSKNTEAILFCCCLATVSTMTQDECRTILKQDKSPVLRKYKKIATQALTNAAFVEHPDLTNLQALSLYLFGVKRFYSYNTLNILCGLAVRLAMRIGLHRDGVTLGLPPFEIELRRRLWWHIIQLDFNTSDLLGIRPSLDIFVGDTKPPSNVDDEDIGPGMTELPRERTGITSLTLVRVRCDITQFLRHLYLSSLSSNASGFDIISSAAVSVEEKERMIAKLQDSFESKYLRYCDPSEPLHMFVSIVIRSVICRMKVLTYNPRYFAEKQMQLTAREREVLFVNASKLLEYAALLRNTPSFHKYIGRTSATYIWDTILYVLIAARHRKAGHEIERLWHLIGILISHNPDNFGRAADAVYTALSKWIPEVWDEYAAAARTQGLPTPVPPDYLVEMKSSRGTARPRTESQEAVTSHSANAAEQPVQTPQKGVMSADDGFQFSDLDAFAADPNEWLQWERLLAGDDLFGISWD